MTYSIDGKIGIDVTVAAATSASTTNRVQWPAGTRTRLNDGSEWIYLKASATIPQYACVVSVDGTTTQAATSTLGLRGMAEFIAQQAYVAGDWGWYLVANPLGATGYKVRVAASCAIDAKLATTAFAGTLDDTTAGTVQRVNGIVLTDSQPSGSSGSRTFRTAQNGLGFDAV